MCQKFKYFHNQCCIKWFLMSSTKEENIKQKTLNVINLSIQKYVVIMLIRNFINPHGCQQYSNEKYERKTHGTKKLFLLKKVCPNENEDNINISIYLKNLKELLDQLHAIDFENPNDLVILMELNFFPKQYNILIKLALAKKTCLVQRNQCPN